MLKRVRHLVQRRAVVSFELLDPICISAERIDFRQGVHVRPHFHSLSPETVLSSGNVGLRLFDTGRNCEECPYNRLRSYLLDAVD